MSNRPSVYQEPNAEAIALARRLLRSARFGSLAVLEPDDGGFPHASRVALGMDIDGVPVTLVSGLAAHTRALHHDPRCSLLVGEVGKGDPLAHPRMSLRCRAHLVEGDSPSHHMLRARYLRRHPKAQLYVDLPDFRFFRLLPVAASLNGGFGRAYQIDPHFLQITSPARQSLAAKEQDQLDILNMSVSDIPRRLATLQIKKTSGQWTVVGLDAAGLDLASKDQFLRVEFNHELASVDELASELHKLYG